MRITTWNINSVRLRLGLFEQLIAAENPDVICLQEIKVEGTKFPAAAFAELGYPYQAIHGQKNYHGVAVVSRLPLGEVRTHRWCEIDDARHQEVELPGGIALHNLYIPSGGDVPDRDRNPKFAHKLDFLREISRFFGMLTPEAKAIAVGDFNIAPLETDVWSHKQLLDVVSHTPIEVEGLAAVQESAGWLDAVRHIIQPEERLYTWWSYRARDWSASDRGRRLDHVWVTPALAQHVRDARVLRAARGWEKPSDHVPVTVDLTDA